MASDFQKRFQRKIDEDEEDEDHEEESDKKPIKLGFTEEKVDYHSEDEPENQKPYEQSEGSKNPNEKANYNNYKSNYHSKPHYKPPPKKEFYKKPVKEYVPKGELPKGEPKEEAYKEYNDYKEPREKEDKNPDFKSWRTDNKPYKKKYPESKKYKEEYDVVYVEKKAAEEKLNNDKKIAFKSTNIKNIKEFVPETDKPTKQKSLKLNAQAFKTSNEGFDENNEEEEETQHVFIGFQQPLDLMTSNPPPINPTGFYQQPSFPPPYQQPQIIPQTFVQPPIITTPFPQYQQPQMPMNYGQGFYPTNNYPYYN